MAPKLLLILILSLLVILSVANAATNDGGGLHLMNGTLEWQLETPFELEEESEEEGERRSLYWHAKKYYISYGALSANRVPCPPRSGRSYYTHNCFRARGPVHPYTRGCSAITRCRR
ncbi:protein RALF-like 34 [Salvia miltiorrhiza]|uniref:protein RALF-like 34 n=1 Tax=Salvia miltiorrhiza TaxID=226208 RepID=UPI0025AD7E0E|nr:protein RALF-like 34 [Salvia miltiorrhiza]